MKVSALAGAVLAGVALVGVGVAPAQAVTIKGTADVCVMNDTPRSWTNGLEAAANRAFKQNVDVVRVREDHIPARCDALVWVNGYRAENYVEGTPAADPRYDVYTGPYAMVPIEINLGSITPTNQRVSVLVNALRLGGLR